MKKTFLSKEFCFFLLGFLVCYQIYGDTQIENRRLKTANDIPIVSDGKYYIPDDFESCEVRYEDEVFYLEKVDSTLVLKLK